MPGDLGYITHKGEKEEEEKEKSRRRKKRKRKQKRKRKKKKKAPDQGGYYLGGKFRIWLTVARW